jgi:hypothetical protein
VEGTRERKKYAAAFISQNPSVTNINSAGTKERKADQTGGKAILARLGKLCGG